MRVFVLASLLLGSTASAAAPSHAFGVTVEAGAPELVAVRLVVRPRTWLRIGAGPVTDLFSAGVSGGVTIVPLKSLVSPSLTVDGGYLFDGDTHGIPQKFGVPIGDGHAAYGFADGHAGLEIGANRRACFFIHAGVSYIDLTARADGFSAAHVRAWSPSGKLGFSAFF